MFEPRHHPVIPPSAFTYRMLRSISFGALIIGIFLGFGMWGYHHYEHMSWLDAYVNAAMILSGMGPLSSPNTAEGKLFAGTYALLSGIIFLLVMGIIFGPLVHRFFHKFHVEEENKQLK